MKGSISVSSNNMLASRNEYTPYKVAGVGVTDSFAVNQSPVQIVEEFSRLSHVQGSSNFSLSSSGSVATGNYTGNIRTSYGTSNLGGTIEDNVVESARSGATASFGLKRPTEGGQDLRQSDKSGFGPGI